MAFSMVLRSKTIISQTKQTLSRPNLQFCPDLVHYLGNKLHVITDEIRRWRDILSVPYQEYKQMKKLEVRSGTYTAGG